MHEAAAAAVRDLQQVVVRIGRHIGFGKACHLDEHDRCFAAVDDLMAIGLAGWETDGLAGTAPVARPGQ